MAFEPVYEKIKVTCERKKLCEQLRLDCKSEVPSEEVSSILSVTAWAVITENEVANGQVNFGGKVIFYIGYVDQEGRLRKCECGNEFKGSIKGERLSDEARAFVTAKIDKTDYELSGTKLSVGGFVTVCASVSECAEGKALSGGDNIIVNESEIPCVKSCGVKSGVFPVEEEFELNYPVAEVLSHQADAVITATQCGVGAIIVDGEVLLSAITLQKNEKSDIIKESKRIPFRLEIECEDAMPNMQATARVKERSHKLDLSVDEEGGKSVLSASVNVCLEGEAFYDDAVTVALDAFSTEQELEISKRDLAYIKTGEVRFCTATAQGRAITEEMPVGTTVLALGGERVEIASRRCEAEKTIVVGTLNTVAYLRDGEGKVFTRKLEIAFESELTCPFDCDSELEIVPRACGAKARIVSVSEIEVDAELLFTVYPEVKGSVKIIDEVKSIGEKAVNDCAISVYIPAEGEELWSLAKRLNVCPKALCFPQAE